MRKPFLLAALIAAFASGIFLANKNKDNQSKLNEMQIENAEALTITELPEVVIECSGTGEGKCYKPDFTRFVMCGERMVYECQYSGHQVDYCTTC